MLREVSHELGLQLIIITHEDSLIEIADRAWNVEHDGRESHVNQIQSQEKQDEKEVIVTPGTGSSPTIGITIQRKKGKGKGKGLYSKEFDEEARKQGFTSVFPDVPGGVKTKELKPDPQTPVRRKRQ
jgi:hypothetical protein